MDSDSIAIALDRLKFYARDAVVTLTQCICKPDATLKINGRQYKIEKLLGEGGFSFVYLIRDLSSDRLYALKKILITSGQEGVKEAMREVEAYRRFRHPNIIKILDSAVVQDEGGEGKIIYLFLPYYSRGNLQDAMASSSVTGNRMPERKLLELFHGTCLAVRAMHNYHLAAVSASYPPTREDDPLVGEPVFDHDEELANAEQGELIPYAHRDIKPANIMIADDGNPVLMDFGSTIKARINVETRQQALLEQDIASEHSSMPYRAPELFDVKTGKTLDEKVDIWSLGCTLFAVAYGHSPFEVDGTSIAMAVGSGRYRHPAGYSENLVSLIDAMLVVDPDQRPDIQKVIDLTEQALSKV
uniref:non-specific serine/threonine protein kinase n=1 Tax=Kwoniella bestiolae CBS 10118 TaxID=1296100 RepID=A0A1B9FQY1_9TREE|nr:NAK protein kinase [Kwoniella bestiolae CBS 10118]OCF21186.1 NAK protein kinase [Kwoniella bestiolae CBS 10118]